MGTADAKWHSYWNGRPPFAISDLSVFFCKSNRFSVLSNFLLDKRGGRPTSAGNKRRRRKRRHNQTARPRYHVEVPEKFVAIFGLVNNKRKRQLPHWRRLSEVVILFDKLTPVCYWCFVDIPRLSRPVCELQAILLRSKQIGIGICI